MKHHLRLFLAAGVVALGTCFVQAQDLNQSVSFSHKSANVADVLEALSAETGVLMDRWAFSPSELILFPVLLVLGALVGFLPAMAAYRTNVAEALQG